MIPSTEEVMEQFVKEPQIKEYTSTSQFFTTQPAAKPQIFFGLRGGLRGCMSSRPACNSNIHRHIRGVGTVAAMATMAATDNRHSTTVQLTFSEFVEFQFTFLSKIDN